MSHFIKINITNATDSPYFFALFDGSTYSENAAWKKNSLSPKEKWEIDYPSETALLVSQEIINNTLKDSVDVRTFVQENDIWQYVDSNGFTQLVESDQKDHDGSVTLMNNTKSIINVSLLKDNHPIKTMTNLIGNALVKFILPLELTVAYANPETPNDFSNQFVIKLNSSIINLTLTNNGWVD
jgi:hypothetical protein